jgi:hypothetical protein
MYTGTGDTRPNVLDDSGDPADPLGPLGTKISCADPVLSL